MKRRRDRVAALAVGVLLIAVLLLSPRRRGPRAGAFAQEGAPVAVALATVRAADVPVMVEAVGTVRSRRQTQIASRVVAEIKEIRRVPGEEVKEHEVLVVLDDRDLRARMDQAEAQRRAREHAKDEAELELNRAKGLLPSGAITRQQYDAASFRLATAVAEQEAATKELQVLAIQLGYATIVAPFSGYLFEKLADPGDLALAGKPILGLYDPQQLRMEAVVDEGLLWRLKVGDALQVEVDALGRTLPGKVSEAVPAVDPLTRTGLAKIDLPADPGLRPGMFGRVRIEIGRRKAFLVPRAAVLVRGQMTLAFVVEDGRARLRLVRAIDSSDLASMEVLTGLADGETIVVSPPESLADGTPVTPAPGSAK